ncbi:MAG: PhoH family protein [Planctomycetaceae bacterium]
MPSFLVEAATLWRGDLPVLTAATLGFRMPTASLSVSSIDILRILFGPQDAILRRLREAFGVNVVARSEQLHLEGTAEQVRQGVEALTELIEIVERKGRLKEEEVARAIARALGQVGAPAQAIDLFEKAKRIAPRTPGQADYVEAIRKNDLVFCRGPAGCGKTYLAVAMAINALRQQTVRKIVLVRPAVEAGERLGYLPGDMLAKVNPFLRPLLDALADMLDYEQVRRYMEMDVIEILPLAFMRGRTLNETFIILDEAQNTTLTQMKMFLTRMGEGSKIVVNGDATQTDLPPTSTSGLQDAIMRLEGIEGIGVVDLSGRDIVRHRLVREIVDAYDDDAPRKNRKKK